MTKEFPKCQATNVRWLDIGTFDIPSSFVLKARLQNRMGGTGLRPDVSGVTPETVAGRVLALASADNQQWTPTDEIRRDAGFDGRDARATNFKTRLTLSSFDQNA